MRDVQLAEVPVGNSVRAVAVISALTVTPGRVRLVLDDERGGSAVVGIDSAKVMAAFRAAGFPPRVGAQVEVTGVVAAPIAHLPKSVFASSIRVVA
ncbi:hypothetical protein ACIQVR_39535 [Streptomyces xanthochromogenes]|uniref:hypothetical protein n=1 Tax=Streptomyces xanthochromogenes TaxID=67384 RepID=UPI003816CA68